MTDKVTTKALFLGVLLIAVIFEVIGDVYFKKWTLEHKNSFFIIGLAIYAIGVPFWALSLKYDFLSKAISVFTILNLVVVILVGVVVFKEQLSLVNKIGIALGVLSVFLIES